MGVFPPFIMVEIFLSNMVDADNLENTGAESLTIESVQSQTSNFSG